jgi:putative nucleotidyltransferase with HDIG domain
MSDNQLKITVIRLEEVRLGMCLAQPIMSPDGEKLLEQGTVLDSQALIDKLVSTGVSKVLVDMGNSLIDTHTPSEKAADEQAFREEIDEPDTIIDNLRQELGVAKKIYESAQQIVAEVMQNIRLGKNVNNRDIATAADDLILSVTRNPNALMSLVNLRKRDEYTFNHSINVAVIALSVARHLNIREPILQQIGIAAIMHDIGKTRVPMRLLAKSAKLSLDEFEIVKMHPVFGVEICRTEGFTDEIILDMVRHHHESYDGKGYPDQLDGHRISRYAALVAIADCYDALTTDRAYKPRVEPPEAIHLINSMANVKFDRRLVFHFIKTIGIFPIGSIVELASGKIAMVVGFSRRNLLKPILKVILNRDGSRNSRRDVIVLGSSDEQIANLSPDFRFLGSMEEVL